MVVDCGKFIHQIQITMNILDNFSEKAKEHFPEGMAEMLQALGYSGGKVNKDGDQQVQILFAHHQYDDTLTLYATKGKMLSINDVARAAQVMAYKHGERMGVRKEKGRIQRILGL